VNCAAYNVEDQERMARASNYVAWQTRLVHRELGQRVLEVGCGVGNFTGTLLEREAVIAVDVEPACVERLQQRYPDHTNLHAFVCDVASPEFHTLSRFRPDSCVCLNVLEHTPDDLEALQAIASVLVPGGSIVLMVPAFQALYGRIDRNLGHFRRYNRGMLHRLALEAGLRLRKAHYSNCPGFFGWWMNAHVLQREAQSARQIEVFDRYLVPLISAVEAVVPPPFGQSLVAVLERP
jgi:SAM-dependent methyltransferase